MFFEPKISYIVFFRHSEKTVSRRGNILANKGGKPRKPDSPLRQYWREHKQKKEPNAWQT